MALEQSFQNAVQIQFNELKKEFATSMNPLKKIFNTAPNTKANQTIDFLGKIDAEALRTAGLRRPGLNEGRASGDTTNYETVTAEDQVVNLEGGRWQNESSSNLSNRYRRNRDTPEAVQLKWYRRSSDGVGRQLHMSLPRSTFQLTGRSAQEAAMKFKERLKEWFERETLAMMAQLLVHPVRENPNIAGYGQAADTQGELKYFDNRYRHMFIGGKTGTGGSASYSSPALISKFFYLTSALKDDTFGSETEESINRNTGAEGALKSKCTILCSNRFYAAFKYLNSIPTAGQPSVIDRDYMGRDMILGGAEVHEFQDYRFLTIPNELWDAIDAASGSTMLNSEISAGTNQATKRARWERAATFPHPDGWDGMDSLLLDGVGANMAADNANHYYAGATGNNASGASKYINAHPLERAVVFDPKGVVFYTPTNLNVELQDYTDFRKTFERFYYKQYHLETIRVWDPLVREFYCSLREESLRRSLGVTVTS